MNNRWFWYSVALSAAVFAVTIVLYPRLPQMMPIHWNIQGQADNYAPKWPGAFLIAFMMAGWCVCFWLLRWLSPRDYDTERFRETFSYILFCVAALLAYIHALTLYFVFGRIDFSRWMMGGLFLFFALLGNVLGRVKRNFWVGVRTPWTLADEGVWNATHRLAGRLWVAGGIAGLILTVLGVGYVWLIAFFLVVVILPAPYSLYLSKKPSANGAAH